MPRTILHADLDAFFASVEQLDDPQLRGKPVAVGGAPEMRGVVAAASYEAREFGVRSAMPMSRALRLCPQLIRVSPRFDRYGELSRKVMAIFRDVTPLVEPLSMDEAFLDVTEHLAGDPNPEDLARHIKKTVRTEVGLTISIGAGANKTVAKIASDMGKPNGLVIVPQGEEAAFLAPLPVRSLWGVGPKAEVVLHRASLRTIGQIAATELSEFERLMGSRGQMLHEMARGTDDRAVTTDYERKSFGAEQTFPRDLADGPELRSELARTAGRVAEMLTHGGFQARTVVLKLRYANFKTITRQNSRDPSTDDADEIAARASALLDAVVGHGDHFRLLGIACSNLSTSGDSAKEADQLELGLDEGG